MTTMTRPKVTFVDLLWLAWRRHRTSILVSSGLVALAALMMVLAGSLQSIWTWRGGGPLGSVYYRLLWQPQYVSLMFGMAVAVFWGAPLVSREYEARTNLVAWGQDVSATRWLAGQLALLVTVAVGLAVVLSLSMEHMTGSNRAASRGVFFDVFDSWFEVAPQVQVGYTLFAIALGVAAGVVTRRVVPAMAIALFGFAVTRIVVVQWIRAHYLPPLRVSSPWSEPYKNPVPDYALLIGQGYADANGASVEYQDVWGCGQKPGPSAQIDCLRANGVVGRYSDFQPLERLGLFRWIETGIFLVLAAGLLVLAWWWVGRARRV